MDTLTLALLNEIKPTESAVQLFNAFLRKTYYLRVKCLQKRRDEADEALKKLYSLRQGLIEKNLEGIYSNEMFREQNKLLEEKIKTIQYTKNDETISKYNLEAITLFVQNKLENLVETYTNSTLDQKRTLMCSIFPSGLRWGYPGYSNTQISPFYTCIVNEQRESIPFGSPKGR